MAENADAHVQADTCPFHLLLLCCSIQLIVLFHVHRRMSVITAFQTLSGLFSGGFIQHSIYSRKKQLNAKAKKCGTEETSSEFIRCKASYGDGCCMTAVRLDVRTRRGYSPSLQLVLHDWELKRREFGTWPSAPTNEFLFKCRCLLSECRDVKVFPNPSAIYCVYMLLNHQAYVPGEDVFKKDVSCRHKPNDFHSPFQSTAENSSMKLRKVSVTVLEETICAKHYTERFSIAQQCCGHRIGTKHLPGYSIRLNIIVEFGVDVLFYFDFTGSTPEDVPAFIVNLNTLSYNGGDEGSISRKVSSFLMHENYNGNTYTPLSPLKTVPIPNKQKNEAIPHLYP
ncbi:hypothetical protein GHT06_016067 [Daphnia sinensis]|uniref:Uncharacterized protein n=1 Tax=Daphnia sinensis TaxID=1820382 RepID=A0AAD5LK90_9CRUS|nr:hypothetical protein GHT06_016067 [Daphnia sinensis]